MNTDYTIAGVSAFQGYPFLFIRVYDREDLDVCAVQAYHPGRVLIVPNVTPVDADAYEVKGQNKPFWIDKNRVYGVTWASRQL